MTPGRRHQASRRRSTTLQEALAGEQYIAGRGLAVSIYPGAAAAAAAVSRGRSRASARPRSPRCSPRALDDGADPAAVLRRPRRQPRGLRVELPAAAPRDPAARSRRRARSHARPTRELFTETFLIKRPLLRAIEADARAAAGPADRRDRSRRRGVRGLPARAAVRLSGHDSRSSARFAPPSRRSSSSPRTARARSTTR